MKKFLTLISFLLLPALFLSLTACDLRITLPGMDDAEDGTADALRFRLREDGESYEVVGPSAESATSVRIPSEHRGKPVRSVKAGAFDGCEGITELYISEGVTEIGYTAFRDCSSLCTVSLPESLKSIGQHAFSGCTSLYEIDIPDGTQTIGASAFRYCTELASAHLGKGVKSIGEYAFGDCTSLSSLSLPEDLRLISSYAFKDCASLTQLSFGGTAAAWEDVEKQTNWDYGIGDYSLSTRPFLTLTYTFLYNGRALSEPFVQSQVAIGEALRIPDFQNEAFEGLEIVGWDMDGDGEADKLPASLQKSITLNAVFEQSDASAHTVTFEIIHNGTSLCAPVIKRVSNGGAAIPPSVSSLGLTGWEITGWDSDGDGKADTKYAHVTSDMTVRALLVNTSETFTVTFRFKLPDGTEISEPVVRRNIKYGGRALGPNSFIDNPCRFEDYVLIGWDSDGDCQPDEGIARVTRNMEVYAIFREKILCTVNLFAEDGVTLIATHSVKEGAALPTDQISVPTVSGKYFLRWENVNLSSPSTVDCIFGNCAFRAGYGAAQGVIPRVSSDITVDGQRDAAYAHAAYLPLNNKRQAEGTLQLENDPDFYASAERTNRYKTDTTAGAYLAWDGDYIYALIEVSDTTLTARNAFYIQAVQNSYLKDAVELFYSCEQDASFNRNYTKVSLDAMGMKLYSTSRDRGIGGGCSTHFAEIEYAADCAFNHSSHISASRGLYATGYDSDGNRAPSYRIEFKIPAKTEGEADMENYPDIDPMTGFIGGTQEDYANDQEYQNALQLESNYKFTDGKVLKAGNLFRVSLQVTDLMVPMEMLADRSSPCHEDSSINPDNDRLAATTYLYNATGQGVYPKFSAVAQTQYDLIYYVWFVLGDDEESLTTVYDFTENQDFLDQNGKIIYRD